MTDAPPDIPDDDDRPRWGWDVVLVFLALLALIGSRLTTWERGTPLPAGDPHALWGGLGFLLWGTAFLASGRFEYRSILFQLLNGSSGPRAVGWIFVAFALFLLGRYVGIW